MKEQDLQIVPGVQGGLAEQSTAVARLLFQQSRYFWAVTMISESLRYIDNPVEHQDLIKNIVEILDWPENRFSTLPAGLSIRVLYTALEKLESHVLAHLYDQCRALLNKRLQRLTSSEETSSNLEDVHPIATFEEKLQNAGKQESPSSKLLKLKELSESAKCRLDYTFTDKALRAATNVATAYATSRRTSESYMPLRDIQSDRLSLHRKDTKQAYFEADALGGLFSTLLIVWKKHTETIDELHSFLEIHPTFEVPSLLERILQQALMAANALGKTILAGELRDQRDCVNKNLIGRSRRIGNNGVESNEFLIEINGTTPHENQRGLNAVAVCLRWAAEEVEQELVSPFGAFISPAPVYSLSKALAAASTLYGFDHENWSLCYNKLKSWLLEDRRQQLGAERLHVLRAIAATRAYRERQAWIDNHRGEEPNLEVAEILIGLSAEKEAVEALDKNNLAAPTQSVIAEKRHNVFQIDALAAVNAAWQVGRINFDSIDRALGDCDDLIRIYSERGNDLGCFTTWCSKGRFLSRKYHQANSSLDVLESLKPYDEADNVFRKARRNNMSTRSGRTADSLTTSLKPFSYRGFCNDALVIMRDAFNTALQRLVQSCQNQIEGEPDVQRMQRLGPLQEQGLQAYVKYLSWTQKCKARLLTELLGIDTRLPRKLIQAYERSPDELARIKNEQKLLSDLRATPFPDSLRIQDEVETLRVSMRQNLILAPVMAIRDGDTVNLGQIGEMLQRIPPGVVLVDFIYMESQKHLLAICYRRDKTFFPARLGVPPLELIEAEWNPILSRRSSHPLNDERSIATLHKLEPLLRPLFEVRPAEIVWKGPEDPACIQKGDTVIFCPVGILHRIPLHAIKVNSEPLIKNHPVAYCQSISLLHHAWHSSINPQNDIPKQLKKVVVNPMGLNSPSIKSIASSLNADLLASASLEREKIITSLQGASLFHYHGHVKPIPQNPMETALCLDEAAYRSTSDGQRLSANDVFDQIKLARPALASIVGCKSAAFAISDMEDQLGLPTALQYAGASAVVSSLWKVDDDDGVEFARAFYGDLREQRRGLDRAREDCAGNNGTESLAIWSVLRGRCNRRSLK